MSRILTSEVCGHLILEDVLYFSFLLSVKFTIKDINAGQHCVFSQDLKFGSAATYIIPSTFSIGTSGGVSHLCKQD